MQHADKYKTNVFPVTDTHTQMGRQKIISRNRRSGVPLIFVTATRP